uniref:Uncharacterized protein n=1 Tax=Siphoviridae sp. ctTnV63 TaxID=2825523 RepID=A0A8S5NW61_9CAUD|nr:MAG TPA: hypothetical protein [Siphoviridae sp. ctTnV63]
MIFSLFWYYFSKLVVILSNSFVLFVVFIISDRAS